MDCVDSKRSFDPRLNVARSAWPRTSGVRRRRWRCLRAGTIWCACMFSTYSPPRRAFSSTEGLQAWVAPRKGTSFTTGAGGWSLGGRECGSQGDQINSLRLELRWVVVTFQSGPRFYFKLAQIDVLNGNPAWRYVNWLFRLFDWGAVPPLPFIAVISRDLHKIDELWWFQKEDSCAAAKT